MNSARKVVVGAHEPSGVAAAVDPRRSSPLASDLMTTNVATCGQWDTLERCAQLMWERACGCVVIIDDEQCPVAMITDRDVSMAAYTQGRRLSQIGVRTAMSGRIFTVDALAPLDAAERLMRLHGIRRLPVVGRDGELVGLLSIADIAAHATVGPTLGRDGLSLDVITATVAALHRSARPPA